MKVVITGATGYVGQNFIPALIENNSSVEILTVNLMKEEAVRLYPQPQCIHITTEELEKIVIFEPDIVFHLATLSTSRNDLAIIEPMVAANIEFGVKVLHYVSQCKNIKLFVNIGSFAQYRMGCQQVNDAYLYTATKTAFRSFVEYYSKLAHFKYVHLVPYTIYGGKDRAKKIIDYIIESLEAIEPVNMTKGEQILDFVNVKDVVGFFVHMVNHLSLFENIKNGEEFHIGTGKGTQIRELAEIIERVFGKKCHINWGGLPYREMDTMHSVAPIAKNLELLKWRANISIEEGIIMTKNNQY
ncbi:MAG: NAD(P)-dependent oxidoreductase [Bacteroidales bacterium]